jgi:hypothetical protein
MAEILKERIGYLHQVNEFSRGEGFAPLMRLVQNNEAYKVKHKYAMAITLSTTLIKNTDEKPGYQKPKASDNLRPIDGKISLQ